MIPKINLHTWLIEARRALKGVGDNPELESQVIASYVFNTNRAWILAHQDVVINDEQQIKLDDCLDRLVKGEPLPYIMGHWEFFGLDFMVSKSVLIPRPETELLVEIALAWVKAHAASRRVADVGTGSGCIAISLANQAQDLILIVSDISLAALQIAKINSISHHVNHLVNFVQCDLVNAITGHIDVFCANLPYIPSGNLPSLKVADWEPINALDGGNDGFYYIENLLKDISERFKPKLILLEIEAGSGEKAAVIAKKYFPFAPCEIIKDLLGEHRILQILL